MPSYVVGDIHGHLDTLVTLLRDAGLVDRRLRWSGRDARLWLLGDLVDRGPDGIGSIDLVMRLEREGPVRCLLGNHEVLMLALWRFARNESRDVASFWLPVWQANGGQPSDLARVRGEHVAWIEQLPAVGRDGDWLLLHADTDRYLQFGRSTEEICATVSAVLCAGNSDAYEDLFASLADRNVLDDPSAVYRLLATLGGRRIVHGHTPITFVTGTAPELVVGPLAYGGGRVLNVDHCLFAGGPGFVTELAVAGDEDDTKSSDAAP